ncbi:AAA domain-containing protein [Halenospora varia]|nr:AAA domain-containing protein [Halenospora varia]
MISHPDVLSSLILETPVDCIYNFLFGPNGRRAIGVFRFISTALSRLVLGHPLYDEDLFAAAITSSLAVLERLIESNQSAQVNEGFLPIVEVISACISEQVIIPNARQSLARIRRRLNIGASFPLALTQSAPESLLRATFELNQDFPGNLSNNGVRHDNDHESISNIQILPTAQEITSRRQDYLPSIDPTKHHLPGLAGLLDKQFRLLREDTVGPLRDARDQGVRKITYQHVYLLRVYVDRKKGLQVVAEFDQPAQIRNKTIKQREEWWKSSKLLQVDSLLCFVSSLGKTIFLSVCDPFSPFTGKKTLDSEVGPAGNGDILTRSDEHPSLFRQPKRASVLLSMAEYKSDDAIWISNHLGTHIKSRQSLVEFPEVLLPSFQPTLQALQKMSHTLDLPFAEIVAPDPQSSNASSIKPPTYTTRRGFVFNLDVLAGEPLTLTPGKRFDFEKLRKGSTLDEAQQVAVVRALSTGLALIQGPPEHLVKDGIKQIIRLGSRSKSELLQNFNIRHVAQGIEPTRTEKHEKWEHNRDIGESLGEIEAILSGLNNPKSRTNIRDHLIKTNIKHFNELFGSGVNADGFQEVRGRKFRVIDRWLGGAPKKVTSNRSVSELSETPLKEMSASEHKCHRELDIRCLRQAHIIGVTTSGLARNIEVLRRVQAKVMLCEEAGEVLEAHTLTALLPGVEHAILIGDHEQLRPQINNYELQHDNPKGERFSLDISLFERLVNPQIGNFQVPLSSLKTQRRMHPSIAELVRVPLYPELQDHPSVLEYPEVDGMRDRLFWFDHQEREDPRPSQAVSLSRTNTFEVDMVAALVSHLVRQGTYGNEDIAVIMPYLGQLKKIKQRLATSFEIVVGDRDLEDLEAQGLQDMQSSTNDQVHAQKTTLLNAVRLATVDNFQGEEAKVIVVSLVRSNNERKCGFLKTSYRINVLLTRARHGMYIIGNSETARPIPMWFQVVSILERSNNLGTSLALCCPRHKDTPIEVSLPDDFARLAPEGGCAKRCSSRLLCGHACPNKCHSAALHRAVRCLERCQRVKKGCDHACPRPCGDRCGAECQVMLSNIRLPCGHVAQKLKCYEAQMPERVLCQVQMEQTMRECSHKIMVRCYELPLSADYPCLAICGAPLPAGTTVPMTAKNAMSGLMATLSSEHMEFAISGVVDHTPLAATAVTTHATGTGPAGFVRNPAKTCEFCQLCAEPTIKGVAVDYILSRTFEEVDLDQNPCIIPSCGLIQDEGSLAAPPTESDLLGSVQLKGNRDEQISQIGSLVGKEKEYKPILRLRQEIKKFLKQVDETEQPFGRIHDLLQDARRYRGVDVELDSNVDILQVDLCINRKECEALIAESRLRNQPGNLVEGQLYWARFVALKRGLAEPGSKTAQLLTEAKGHLQQAREICDKYPGQTAGMRNEVENIEKMLRSSTFYMPVSSEEMAVVYAAMSRDFRGTGHWYYCANGHPFTIGECGMPMETSQCPQCGSTVGGRNHEAVDGVRRAVDFEPQFSRLGIGS